MASCVAQKAPVQAKDRSNTYCDFATGTEDTEVSFRTFRCGSVSGSDSDAVDCDGSESVLSALTVVRIPMCGRLVVSRLDGPAASIFERSGKSFCRLTFDCLSNVDISTILECVRGNVFFYISMYFR